MCVCVCMCVAGSLRLIRGNRDVPCESHEAQDFVRVWLEGCDRWIAVPHGDSSFWFPWNTRFNEVLHWFLFLVAILADWVRNKAEPVLNLAEEAGSVGSQPVQRFFFFSASVDWVRERFSFGGSSVIRCFGCHFFIDSSVILLSACDNMLDWVTSFRDFVQPSSSNAALVKPVRLYTLDFSRGLGPGAVNSFRWWSSGSCSICRVGALLFLPAPSWSVLGLLLWPQLPKGCPGAYQWSAWLLCCWLSQASEALSSRETVPRFPERTDHRALRRPCRVGTSRSQGCPSLCLLVLGGFVSFCWSFSPSPTHASWMTSVYSKNFVVFVVLDRSAQETHACRRVPSCFPWVKENDKCRVLLRGEEIFIICWPLLHFPESRGEANCCFCYCPARRWDGEFVCELRIGLHTLLVLSCRSLLAALRWRGKKD